MPVGMIRAPIMALRTLLLRLLLVAAFFNAAVGVSLHESGHLRELVAAATQDAQARPIGETGDEPSSQAEASGLCAWCTAYATQATPLAFTTALAVPAQALAPHPVRGWAAFTPQGWHWRFAARDPPLALLALS
jgi:hypothetical protein